MHILKRILVKFTEGNHTMDDKHIFGCLRPDNRCTCQGCPGQTEPTPKRVSTHSTPGTKSSECMRMYIYSIQDGPPAPTTTPNAYHSRGAEN